MGAVPSPKLLLELVVVAPAGKARREVCCEFESWPTWILVRPCQLLWVKQDVTWQSIQWLLQSLKMCCGMHSEGPETFPSCFLKGYGRQKKLVLSVPQWRLLSGGHGEFYANAYQVNG